MSTLSKKGYILPKCDLSEDCLAHIRKELTVKPNLNPDYVFKPVESYQLYRENATHICVPRYYGQAKFGPAASVRFEEFRARPRLKSYISLRPQQEEVVESTMQQLRATGGAVMALATGFGKTLICLHIIGLLRVKTLIIVHKSFLMHQWRERIKQYMPHASIGVIQGSTVDTDHDIIIGMIQSLSMKVYPKETFDGVACIACDECHHVAAEVFCRALPKVVVPYTLGLSATVERKDGLTSVIHWYLGDVSYRLEKNQIADRVMVKQIIYTSTDSKYTKVHRSLRGTIMLPRMINTIVDHTPRNKAILHEITAVIHESDRQVMVLSDRLRHLHDLKRDLEAMDISIVRDGCQRALVSGLYTGQQKQQELKATEKADVIFATRAMSSEGLDIPSLNTLILATPAGDVVQACGRIMRKQHAFPALIIDFVDGFSIFLGQARKRSAFYKRAGYSISTEHCDDNGNRWGTPVEHAMDTCLIESD